MHPNSKQFKDLQAKWYAKLKKTGFIDVEDIDGRIDIDKALHNIVTKYDQLTYQLKEEYYRLAGQFLYEHKFKSKEEKLIWRHHVEGIGIREIVLILNKKGYKTYRRKVHETIQALVAEMRNLLAKKPVGRRA